MIAETVATFDRLAREGVITGYTLEAPPLYLEALSPTLTYSMYATDELSRRNIRAVLGDLSILGAAVTVRPVYGNVRREDGHIERSDQRRIAARFERPAQLDAAVERIQSRYMASVSAAWHPGSWLYPDVRVTGVRTDPPGTIRAVAHTMPVGRRSIVVLSLSPQPPLPRMTSFPVRLLDRWGSYLDGKHDAGPWAAAPDEYQMVTVPLAASGR
ncbi:MAG: hypothetical protein M3Z11_02735 [Candidatus Dormibacteraeota bacterium]|nr:hypothetical protein [Candidatus Dormibacteraeota bacterium]